MSLASVTRHPSQRMMGYFALLLLLRLFFELSQIESWAVFS